MKNYCATFRTNVPNLSRTASRQRDKFLRSKYFESLDEAKAFAELALTFPEVESLLHIFDLRTGIVLVHG